MSVVISFVFGGLMVFLFLLLIGLVTYGFFDCVLFKDKFGELLRDVILKYLSKRFDINIDKYKNQGVLYERK